MRFLWRGRQEVVATFGHLSIAHDTWYDAGGRNLDRTTRDRGSTVLTVRDVGGTGGRIMSPLFLSKIGTTATLGSLAVAARKDEG